MTQSDGNQGCPVTGLHGFLIQLTGFSDPGRHDLLTLQNGLPQPVDGFNIVRI